jgi:DNA-binding response OmpR family regulator/anti-sigma regulatory factor (Ser/Thr protein kinase)
MNGVGPAEQVPRIMIVDDHPHNIVLLKTYLKPTNFEIIEASDGIEALQKARSELPDLIILDVMLPGMDGYDVCTQLKADESTECIPIIMMTVLNEVKDKLKALDLGADDFLSKPFNQVELIARVKSLLRIKRLIERVRLKEREQVELIIALEKERISLEKERQVRHIFRDILLALTQNKLHLLLDNTELSLFDGAVKLGEVEIKEAADLATAKKSLESSLKQLAIEKSRLFNMMVCMSEATTNAIKHAGTGSVSFFRLGTRVQVRVEDNGKGIDFSELPRSTLLRGYSSKVSLGMGYTIMLELMDKVYLLTSSQGTTVIIEMETKAGEDPINALASGSEGARAAM